MTKSDIHFIIAAMYICTALILTATPAAIIVSVICGALWTAGGIFANYMRYHH